MTKTPPGRRVFAFALFTVNQRVRVQLPREPARAGIVRGFSRDRQCVRVQLDGHKTVSNYHPDYLAPEAPPR